MSRQQPVLSNAGLTPSESVSYMDEHGELHQGQLAAERPLTVFINKQEIVTLMTLGTEPELLILGWLRNQRLVESIADIKMINVDWEVEAAAITTHTDIENLQQKTSKKTVTTGCGQGTVFGDLMENLEQIKLPQIQLKQSTIYSLLANVNTHNAVYKKAGAVHGCALCQHSNIEKFVEDVGRHNAVDALAGHMWLEAIPGDDKIFYTTGRLTSEMVIKVAQMGIPVLLSRSGATQMGLQIAQKLGVILIARAKGKHFIVYHGAEQIELDARPPKIAATASKSAGGG